MKSPAWLPAVLMLVACSRPLDGDGAVQANLDAAVADRAVAADLAEAAATRDSAAPLGGATVTSASVDVGRLLVDCRDGVTDPIRLEDASLTFHIHGDAPLPSIDVSRGAIFAETGARLAELAIPAIHEGPLEPGTFIVGFRAMAGSLTPPGACHAVPCDGRVSLVVYYAGPGIAADAAASSPLLRPSCSP